MSDARETTAGTMHSRGPSSGRRSEVTAPSEPLPYPETRRVIEPEIPECYGDVCVTCSDQAVPVRVVRLLDDDLALVDTGVSEEEVSVAFVDATVGDTVLVHAKEAIQLLPAI